MKILHVITSLRTGGAEKLIVDLVPRLNQIGPHQVDVALFDGIETPFKQKLQATGCKIYDLSHHSCVYHPILIYRLCKLMRHYDVVHTHNTAPQLFAAIEGDPIKIAVYLHFFGVLRREEVCGLDWESVDMTRRQFSVEQVYKQFSHPQMGKTLILNKLTKTSATKRIQPIADALFNLLDTIPEAKRSGPICLGIDGKRMDLDYLTKHFAFILKNNGLKHIRLHELRHSAITLMLMNGVIEITVKKLAGHKVYGTTGHHYTVIDIDEKRKGIAVLNRLFSDSDA